MRFDVNKLRIILNKKHYQNFVTLNEEDCELIYLNNKYESNRGVNAYVFLLNYQSEEIQRVIKIFKYPLNSNLSKKNKQRLERFKREIRCLYTCKEKKLTNIIEIYNDGEISIGHNRFHYYIMEKADTNLTNHLLSNRLTVQQI